MTLFSDRDERILENLRIHNARFLRKPRKLPVRGERPAFALGGSAPTLVIAASNSPFSTMQKADYICTGTDDNLLFQLAIQRMADGEGGRLLVCEGDYYFSNPVVILGDLRVEGMGMNSSRIHMASGSNASMFHLPSPYGGAFELDSITLDGQKALQSSGTPTAILFDPNAGTGILSMHKVRVFDFLGNGITLDRPACQFFMTSCIIETNGLVGAYLFVEGHYMIANSIIEGNGTIGISANGAALELVGSIIRTNGGHGFSTGGVFESTQKLITGNAFSSNGGYGLNLDAVNLSLTGNYINSNTSGGVLAVGNESLSITGNVITSNTGIGATLSQGGGSRGGTFSGNVVKSNGQHGAYLEGANWLVSDNRFDQNGQTTTNTYDDIHVASPGDDCSIHGNLIRPGPSNVTRYGINVAAGATNNWIHTNDVRDGHGTGRYNDAGTGTIWVVAGTFGDNY